MTRDERNMEMLLSLQSASNAYIPQPQRFFVDTLTTTGELFLVSASRRAEWQAFDIASEETAELLPVPAWARRVAELSHPNSRNRRRRSGEPDH